MLSLGAQSVSISSSKLIVFLLWGTWRSVLTFRSEVHQRSRTWDCDIFQLSLLVCSLWLSCRRIGASSLYPLPPTGFFALIYSFLFAHFHLLLGSLHVHLHYHWCWTGGLFDFFDASLAGKMPALWLLHHHLVLGRLRSWRSLHFQSAWWWSLVLSTPHDSLWSRIVFHIVVDIALQLWSGRGCLDEMPWPVSIVFGRHQCHQMCQRCRMQRRFEEDKVLHPAETCFPHLHWARQWWRYPALSRNSAGIARHVAVELLVVHAPVVAMPHWLLLQYYLHF